MSRITTNQKTIIFIIIAYIFSIACRFIWVYQFDNVEQFKFNNQFMINTNDGYYWAEGARDILANTHQENDLSPIDTATANLTAFLVKILPFSFESVIFYMSGFFASLVVIPIILIGKKISQLEAGFIASLLSSIAWSYYNRTMFGYYDTDMLNIVLPTLLLWSLIWAIDTKQNKYLLLIGLEIVVYRWWYPQSYALESSFFALVSIYTIYKYTKKEDISFEILLLTFMMFAMLQLHGFVRFVFVVGLYIFVRQQKELLLKYLYHIFVVSILLYFVTGGFNPIWGKLKAYVFKDHISVTNDILQLHFYTVMQTIKEAGLIPFTLFANRISGSVAVFVVSIIGYIWLLFRHRVMLLTLPMLGLGFLAISGGLRFTIYAVPILAFGIGYFIVQIASFIKNNFMRYIVIAILTCVALVPNILHIINYKVPSVFTKDEVVVLNQLKKIASRDDYVVSWWDYGYPIRYYSDTKTLSDGGKHSGSVNFATSYALTHTQQEASTILKLDVAYTNQRFIDAKDNTTKWQSTNIGQMIGDYGYNNASDFITALQGGLIKPPKLTNDIYLYLPSRMLNIFPTIDLFSNLDLDTGAKYPRAFFYLTQQFQENNKFIFLGNNISLDKQRAILHIGNKKTTINHFDIVGYSKNKKLHTKSKILDPSSQINIIYLQSYHQFLILDNRLYNSTYIQLFVFENYDPKLYKPIILTPLAKVYKCQD